MKRFTKEELFRARNAIPVRIVVEKLSKLATKEIEGVVRHLCPVCNELQGSFNPNANLSRCWRCKKNFNPIDILMAATGLSFSQSVKKLLETESLLTTEPLSHKSRERKDSLSRIETHHLLSCLLNNPYACD